MSVRTTEPASEPYLGRVVAYKSGPGEGEWVPAVVEAVREDGWTVSLWAPLEDTLELIPYGGAGEFGIVEPGTWVTLSEYEGWKIWASERADREEAE